MKQLAFDWPEAARRACMVYQRAEPWTKDELERRVTRRPWRESKALLVDEEVIESELLTTPGAVSESWVGEEASP